MNEKPFELFIDSLANSGDGVGRINNKVIFVPRTCPGDLALVRIKKDKKTYAFAALVELIQQGPERTAPLCPYYENCGGCQLQHIHYSSQLQWKTKNLLTTLEKIGGLTAPFPMTEIVASPKQYHYRNRIQVHLDSIGPHFMARASHKPVYVNSCHIASPQINESLATLKPLRRPKKQKLELALHDGGVGIYSVDPMGHSELGFRQVNEEQNQFLIDKTLSLFKSANIHSVLDLYCGQGNWLHHIHKHWPDLQCVGVDNNPVNIEKANSISKGQIRFHLSDAMEFLAQAQYIPDLLILDPPRKGLDPQLIEQLSQNSRPQWLVYISCQPATLARDLKQLTHHAYQIRELIPVDMFPQTAHLETWCLLQSNS
jgi:23S rRNA (uracil1939-C5)-methyltransferase